LTIFDGLVFFLKTSNVFSVMQKPYIELNYMRSSRCNSMLLNVFCINQR